MTAEIITIGDELLIGQVVDTNSAWMGEQLSMAGVRVRQITSISDNREQIIETLESASRQSGLVLITGGLGPTKDDITKQALCEYFGTRLILSPEAYQNVERIFASRGMPVTELNRQQAMVPEGCTVLPNNNGTAPGLKFVRNGTTYVSMPGVPFEMKAIITDYVLPELQKNQGLTIIHRTILTQGIGESLLAARIEAWEDSLPPFLKLAYLPQPGIVRLRLSATGPSRPQLEAAIAEAEKKLCTLAGEYIFGYDDDTLESVVGQLLRRESKTLATAESCTGGAIAALITSVAGSSDYFKGSVVAYANEIKQNILGVPPEILAAQGAVSEETVKAMARGVREKLETDYAVAVSGIAGPGGATDGKPVGTTWIAVASGTQVSAAMFRFGDHRGRNIRRASIEALNMLRKFIVAESGR